MKTVVHKDMTFSKYEVSEDGKIFRKGSSSPLKPWDDSRGYLVVELMSDDAIAIKVKVHLAVAHTYIGPQKDGLIINHIDGNKHNSAVKNLEYISQRENVEHAQSLIRNKEYVSREKHTAIMSDVDSGMSIAQAGLKHDIASWVVRDLVAGKTYTHYKEGKG